MDREIKEMRDKIAAIYDGLSPFKRNLLYTVLLNSPPFVTLKNNTLRSSKLFSDTLTKEYKPNEDFNFGTVLDQIRLDNHTVNVNTHSVYSGLLHIITGIKDNKIKRFDNISEYLNPKELDNVNAILAIKPNAYNASAVPTTESSSAAVSQQYSPLGVNLPSPSIRKDKPSSCAISGGARGRRRRGTKRARRGRRRSSRKN